MMKIDDIVEVSTTQTVESTAVSGLWLSRSALMLRAKSGVGLPIFGFAANFDRELSRAKSIYELAEHLAFHPEKPLLPRDVALWERTNGRWRRTTDHTVDDLLLGASLGGNTLHGNGCAVHRTFREAVQHAEYEVLERHYCCRLWYHRDLRMSEIDTDLLIDCTRQEILKLYEIETPTFGHLIIATMDAPSHDFFCMGASMKQARSEAIFHAIGEAAMLFEDALERRSGYTPTVLSKNNVLSLRNPSSTNQRRQHFLSLLENIPCALDVGCPSATYAFRVSSDFVAARATSTSLLAPRSFHTGASSAPIMPLF